VEVQRVVGGQTDVEALGQELGKRAALVAQEELVVAQGRHGHAHLAQEIQVLQDRALKINGIDLDGYCYPFVTCKKC